MKKKLEMPAVLTNLYRDLRDRRLLVVVVGLLIAIVAIPFALAKKPSSPAVPATATPHQVASQLTVPAVTLADQPGVTNYRWRLARFKTKNPFKAQFVVKSASSGSAGGSSTPFVPSSTSPSSSSGSSGTSTPLPVAPAVTPTSTSTPPTPTGNGGNGGGNGGNGGGNKPTIRTVTRLFTRRVDLTIGKVGDTPKSMKSVEPMTILPNSNSPVIAFLGTDEQGKNAAFVLSSRSVATGGTASCVPSPQDCIYLTMKAGQSIRVDYTPESSTTSVSYRLTLSKIRDVNVKDPQSAHPAQAARGAGSGWAGG